MSAVQVIKGFAAKSDGKDKLTALVQVRMANGRPASCSSSSQQTHQELAVGQQTTKSTSYNAHSSSSDAATDAS